MREFDGGGRGGRERCRIFGIGVGGEAGGGCGRLEWGGMMGKVCLRKEKDGSI